MKKQLPALEITEDYVIIETGSMFLPTIKLSMTQLAILVMQVQSTIAKAKLQVISAQHPE